MLLKYNIEKTWELLDDKLANKESWESNLGNKGKTKTDYDCLRKFCDNGESEDLTNCFDMDSTDMMQVLEQFTKHLQVPKSRWEKHEEADEPIASVIPKVEPSLKDAKNSNTEKFVVGFNQEQKRPFSMFPPKKSVQKSEMNELWHPDPEIEFPHLPVPGALDMTT